ncbi:MAG: hypothetical protein PHV32_07250 [Eubacteriales bacterium]|nr:hypothetical protein [Kiritimatiellia bacterium]MDD4494132.1 hypothetical protein [Eubacteriales bacterium]
MMRIISVLGAVISLLICLFIRHISGSDEGVIVFYISGMLCIIFIAVPFLLKYIIKDAQEEIESLYRYVADMLKNQSEQNTK